MLYSITNNQIFRALHQLSDDLISVKGGRAGEIDATKPFESTAQKGDKETHETFQYRVDAGYVYALGKRREITRIWKRPTIGELLQAIKTDAPLFYQSPMDHSPVLVHVITYTIAPGDAESAKNKVAMRVGDYQGTIKLTQHLNRFRLQSSPDAVEVIQHQRDMQLLEQLDSLLVCESCGHSADFHVMNTEHEHYGDCEHPNGEVLCRCPGWKLKPYLPASPAVNQGDGSPAVNQGDGSPAVNQGDGSPAVNQGDGSPIDIIRIETLSPARYRLHVRDVGLLIVQLVNNSGEYIVLSEDSNLSPVLVDRIIARYRVLEGMV